MRKLTHEERYKASIRKQQKTLEEFAAHEIEWAEHLIEWYRLNGGDMPDDEYRAAAFFMNREYRKKAGSLFLLYKTYVRCLEELPLPTRENAFDLLCFRFRMYAAVLKTGGYDGRADW